MPPTSDQPATRKRKGSRHDKTGCLTCRYRRKKCVDNTFPICGSCARLNLECVREPARSVVPATANVGQVDASGENAEPIAQTAAVMASSPIVASPAFAGLGTDTPLKRHAMRYYISVLTTHLTVSQEFNSFLTAFLPMAMESVALSDALLALATGHLALIDETQKVAALETRSKAIRNLVASITTQSDDLARQETNAASCLAFVIYETGVGDHRAWYTHLKGTQQIISSAKTCQKGQLLTGAEAFKTSTEGQWILRNFAYHDIIASVTLQTKPLLEEDILEGITDVTDSCLGVATPLLRIVSRTCCLEKDTAMDDSISNKERQRRQHIFLSTYAQLEDGLLGWHCQPDADAGLASLAYAYRNAALIILYRLKRTRFRTGFFHGRDDSYEPTTEGLEEVQAKIQSIVSDTLDLFSSIPVSSAPESAMLFPVFIVGGEVLEQPQIDEVRARLRQMFEQRQFRNLSQAWEVLEDLWELRKDSQGSGADWTQLLTASGQNLLLT
ncbi:fungal specific transcription factor domain-containing protein [Sarocladium implicatum]|nr:fungal specific transcription factor domain-containing protein [Sarocladium implicatum]